MATKQVGGVVIRLDIPPSSHPGTIQGETPGAALGRTALEGIYNTFGKINDIAGQVQSKELLAVSAQPHIEKTIASASKTLTRLASQADHMSGEIASDITAQKGSPQAAEIRKYWGDKKTPMLDLSKLFQAGDALTISAVLSAPSYLSGVTEKQQGELRSLAASVLVPDKVNALKETADAIAKVQRATTHFSSVMAENINTWQNRDAKLIEEGLK